MAHVRVNEAQQTGAFNNGAVGQQSRSLCPYPYVWDRVRKECVLPDEFTQVRAYQGRVPMWNHLSYLDWPGALPTYYSGLGQTCPEGSGKTAAYSGPLDPGGSGCRCSPGRVWHNGYCQSPQAVSQQAGSKFTDYGGDPQEDLTPEMRAYFRAVGMSVTCKIDTDWSQGPQGGVATRVCSIDGGPYIHAAYAINRNPQTAIDSARWNKAVEEAAKAAGVEPGQLPHTQAVTDIAREYQATGVMPQDVSAGQQAAQIQQLRNQLQSSLVVGADIDERGRPISWRAEMVTSNDPTLLQEALAQRPGYELPGMTPRNQVAASGGAPYVPISVDTAYEGVGIAAGPQGGAGAGWDIPWWVWAAGAVGVVVMMGGGGK